MLLSWASCPVISTHRVLVSLHDDKFTCSLSNIYSSVLRYRPDIAMSLAEDKFRILQKRAISLLAGTDVISTATPGER